MRTGLELLALAALAPPALAQGALLTVDPAGGPADFSTIQAAVDAASDGDVILVDSSAPFPIPAAAGFAIDGKSLTVLAEEFAGPFTGGKQVVEPSAIRNLSADQRVVLRGLQFTSNLLHNLPSLHVESCGGPVFVEDCNLTAGLQPGKREGLVATECDGVVVARCAVDAGGANPFGSLTAGRAGIRCVRSRVLLYASEITGGGGVHTGGGAAGPPLYGLPGMPAVQNEDGELFASGCVLRGGDGGDGALDDFACLAPGAGGPAVSTEGAGTSSLHDLVLIAGAPGDPAPGCDPVPPTPPLAGSGTVVELSGKARGLIAPAPLGPGEVASFELFGQPGDFAVLEFSLVPAISPHLDAWSALAAPKSSVRVGTVGPGGVLSYSVVPAPLAPGCEALTVWFQARFVPLGGGVETLSNPSAGVRIDPRG